MIQRTGCSRYVQTAIHVMAVKSIEVDLIEYESLLCTSYY